MIANLLARGEERLLEAFRKLRPERQRAVLKLIGGD